MTSLRFIAGALAIALVASPAQAAQKAKAQNLSRTRDQLTAGGEIAVGSVKIPRAAPAPFAMSAAGQTILNDFFKACLMLPPGLGLTDYRARAQAEKAASSATPVSGKPFGKLAIFMPGLGGWGPSAAFVFRLARYSERVVVAYQGIDRASANQLRVAAHIDGVPVPKALRGKVLTLGEGKNRAILTPEAGADLLITYFELMRQKQNLLGFDPLTAKATLFGHSEGSFITLMARERLQKAGLPDAIGKLVVMAGGLGAKKDTQWAPMLVMQGYKKVVDKLGHPSNLAEVTRSYERIVGSFSGKEQLVDLAVAGKIGPPLRLSGLHIEGMNDIRPGMRFAVVGEAGFDMLGKPWKSWSSDLLKLVSRKSTDDNDGIIKLEWASFGRKLLRLEKPHDHANMIEDPEVVDEMARAL